MVVVAVVIRTYGVVQSMAVIDVVSVEVVMALVPRWLVSPPFTVVWQSWSVVQVMVGCAGIGHCHYQC